MRVVGEMEMEMEMQKAPGGEEMGRDARDGDGIGAEGDD